MKKMSMQLSKFCQIHSRHVFQATRFCAYQMGYYAMDEVASDTKTALSKGFFLKMLLLKVLNYFIYLSTSRLLL